MSKLNFVRDIIQYCTGGSWNPLNAGFTEGNVFQEVVGKEPCDSVQRRGRIRRSRSIGGPKSKRPCNLVTSWRQASSRHRLLVAEVCEALLDLHLSDESPATKTEILREMDERGTKPEVRRVFQNKPPSVEEFNSAFRYSVTFGLIRALRSSNGKYKYCLDERLKEILQNIRSCFDDVIEEMGAKVVPSRR